jgi:hypothetical protein
VSSRSGRCPKANLQNGTLQTGRLAHDQIETNTQRVLTRVPQADVKSPRIS